MAPCGLLYLPWMIVVFDVFVETLGQRLEQHPTLAANACLCYICAGSLPQLVTCLDTLTQHSGSPDTLQVDSRQYSLEVLLVPL